MKTLRPYQVNAVNSIWRAFQNEERALCVISTGGGKSTVFVALIHRALTVRPDLRVLILLNNVRLLKQTVANIQDELPLVQVGAYCGSVGERCADSQITVATIQSIHSIDIGKIHLLILDEAHNISESDGQYYDFIERLALENSRLRIAAFTATPFRAASGYIYGKGKMFERITYKMGLQELIGMGYLVPPSMKRVNEQYDVSGLHTRLGEFKQDEVAALVSDRNKIRAQIKDALPRLEYRKSILWVCATIDHCEEVASELYAQGQEVDIVHSKCKNQEAVMSKFSSGALRNLVFVTMLKEGIDIPRIDAIVIMRPIKSPVLWVQLAGRALRPFEGKTNALILDYGKVVETCGPLDHPNVKDSSKRIQPLPIPMRFCKHCLEYITLGTRVCPNCQAEQGEERNPIRSLTRTAASGSILSTSEEQKKNITRVGDIDKIVLSSFMSKSGNDCLRIHYYFKQGSMFELGRFEIKEHYAWDIVRAKAHRRLQELGVTIQSKLNMQVLEQVTRTPKRVVFLDEKYPKVIRLEYA